MDNPILRVCIHCNLPKTFKELVKDKRKEDGVISVCIKCSHELGKKRPSYIAAKAEHNRKYREEPEFAAKKKLNRQQYHRDFLERVILSNARCRATRKGLEFTIEESDIVIPKVCPLLGIPIFRGTNTVKANSPSLDRVDSRLGYIKGNCRVISYKANTMKNDADPNTLRLFIRNLEAYLNNDIV